MALSTKAKQRDRHGKDKESSQCYNSNCQREREKLQSKANKKGCRKNRIEKGIEITSKGNKN